MSSSGALTEAGKIRQEILRLDLARDSYPQRGSTWEVLTQKIISLEKSLEERTTGANTPMVPRVSITTFLEKLSQGENGDAHK